jgi:rod shape-determining protein MreB
VHVDGVGIVLCEPSVVAVDVESNQVLAVGGEAKQMIGRTPGNIIAIRPIKDGVIADYDYTQAMLKYFINKAVENKGFLTKIRVVVCIPSGITTVEERAIKEAAIGAGAAEAHLISEPMAAAIGVGLDVYNPTGNMIVDIGGGTTEAAVISLGGVVTVKSIRVAGDDMDNAIINHIRRNYNLLIGERTAEQIKIAIGNAYLDESNYNKTLDVRGRDTINGLPRTVNVSAKEINTALSEPVEAIVETIKACLENTPPELAADIMDKGIFFAGGGSLLYGLPRVVSTETGIATHLAEDALSAVVIGTGQALKNIDFTKRKRFFNRGLR